MKLIYSYLQKFLPDLSIEPQKLRDDLNMIGHFTNFYNTIPLLKGDQGGFDYVFDLDIKVNRGDCLGYYGLAKDLSILYNIPLVLPQNFSYPNSNYTLPIKVDTTNVIRVMAVKIVHLKNSISPDWLQTFLKLHGVNSINTLVDLTNYVMFMYGIPNHAFDTAKSTDNLIWQMNPRYTEFVSLDKTKLTLDQSILMINNPSKALSLSFWGGQACAITETTTDTVVEMAIYNPTTVRQNSRQLKAVTEASIRLEKQLDPELIPVAFNALASLIIKHCGGQVGSQIFDYYPHPALAPVIEFDPKLPSIVSGINIPESFALDIVKKVGSRPDITQEEDLVEEVVRFYGYDKIPTNQPLKYKQLPDITPKVIYLIEQLKDKMVADGYDEVLTWPLVSIPTDPKTVITTQNSINSESIYLRQSLIPSLKAQLDQYNRYKLPGPKFFEIGKIYYLEKGQYIEKFALALYNQNPEKLRRDVPQNVSAKNIKFDDNFAEIILDNLPKPDSYTPIPSDSHAIELTNQIITLDANVISDQSTEVLLKHYQSTIDPNILWQISIADHYQNKYTFHVSYYNCDDKTAKKIHLAVFNLI
ncbi:MAG: phenylalanine--tRNA ligase beta subunit-related protein [Candidatus Shapirobacteria bacterium]|nr:phenylalanine--tRNA ligase beta subunit-related protein [Candidatus Shapirobacteria bacterium]